MHWIGYLTVVGLWARAAQEAGLAPPGRPVVILKEGRAWDGCREAFVGGLVLGAPARQVGRDLPGAVIVDAAHIEAEGYGRAWWDQILRYTPYIEPLEPQTAFVGLPARSDGLTEAVRAEFRSLQAIAAAAGFIAFGGLGSSRPVARAAALACRESWLGWRPGRAARAAPAPLQFVPPGEEAAFLAPLPISFLGLPADLERRLGRLGIRTAGEAAAISEAEWIRQFGGQGRLVARWSRGIEPERVRPAYPARSLERRVNLVGEAPELDELESRINRIASVLAGQLAAKGEGCQKVGITLELTAGSSLMGSRTLPRLQQRAYALQQALGHVLRQVYTKPVPLSALTVRLAGIGPMPWEQMVLWGETAVPDREAKVEEVLSLLHERFPSRLIGRGPRRQSSWREQMLCLNDPYRWSSGEAGPWLV
jgi:nucleotidyltransferase/DNA polymerase involved in DNA repair